MKAINKQAIIEKIGSEFWFDGNSFKKFAEALSFALGMGIPKGNIVVK